MLCNVDRARALMERAGVEALVATTYENVAYLSGYDNPLPFYSGTRAAAVLPLRPDRDPTLVVSMVYVGYLADRPTWMPSIRWFGSLGVRRDPSAVLEPPESLTEQSLTAAEARADRDLSSALRTALAEAGVAGRRVAIDDVRVGAALPEGTAEWVDGTALLLDVRAVKTPDEVERIRFATAVNDRAFRAAANAAVPGGRWADVTRAWRTAWAAGDGTAGFWGSGAGRYAAQLFDPHADYDLRRGDTIRFEGGGWYRGYWADGGRSAVLGPPSDRQRRLAEAQRAGAEEAQRRLGPGARPAEVVAAVHATIAKRFPAFPVANVWGHGIGLTANEMPSVRASATVPLEVGNVVCFETPYFELGWGAMQMEDTYLVTGDGCERLTTADRELMVIEGGKG